MVCILLGTGFEEIEALAPCDILRRGGVDVKLVGVSGMSVIGGHGIKIYADISVDEVNIGDVEMVVVPGGLGGVEAIEASEKAMALVREAYDNKIKVAAICAGPRVLGKLGILKNKSAVCYPGMENEMTCGDLHEDTHVVVCGDIITGRGPGSAMQFGFAILEQLRGSKVTNEVRTKMHY